MIYLTGVHWSSLLYPCSRAVTRIILNNKGLAVKIMESSAQPMEVSRWRGGGGLVGERWCGSMGSPAICFAASLYIYISSDFPESGFPLHFLMSKCPSCFRRCDRFSPRRRKNQMGINLLDFSCWHMHTPRASPAELLRPLLSLLRWREMENSSFSPITVLYHYYALSPFNNFAN